MKVLASIVLLSILIVTITVTAAPPSKSENEFVRPFPIVAVPMTSTDAQKSLAKQVADALGITSVATLPKNPVCCIWIEVTGWTPNPGKPGYFIINQGDGSVISASDDEQLRAAVQRFKNSIRKSGNDAEIPGGMLTNYRIAAVSE